MPWGKTGVRQSTVWDLCHSTASPQARPITRFVQKGKTEANSNWPSTHSSPNGQPPVLSLLCKLLLTQENSAHIWAGDLQHFRGLITKAASQPTTEQPARWKPLCTETFTVSGLNNLSSTFPVTSLKPTIQDNQRRSTAPLANGTFLYFTWQSWNMNVLCRNFCPSPEKFPLSGISSDKTFLPSWWRKIALCLDIALGKGTTSPSESELVTSHSTFHSFSRESISKWTICCL